ncbi:MAG: LicD family protein [Cytophagaceae bacterium]|jgi:hypothetical protein|nr:LicD family protein [Cytophagaceae bacterium]
MSNRYDFNNPETLAQARKMLLKVVSILDNNHIPYFLEAGTLLGIVRDGDLIPWDHDMDLCITNDVAVQLLKIRRKFLAVGFKVSMRRHNCSSEPIQKGDLRMIKIKPIPQYIRAMFTGTSVPNYPVIDIFVKYRHAGFVFWEVEKNILKTSDSFYRSSEEIKYEGKALKAPLCYKEYLKEKYGDWQTPKREWELKTGDFMVVKGDE